MSVVTEFLGREAAFHINLGEILISLGIDYEEFYNRMVSGRSVQDESFREEIGKAISLAMMTGGDPVVKWFDPSRDLYYTICSPLGKAEFCNLRRWAEKNGKHLVPHDVPDWDALLEEHHWKRFVCVTDMHPDDPGYIARSKEGGLECVKTDWEFSKNDYFLIYSDPDERPLFQDVTPREFVWKSSGNRLFAALEPLEIDKVVLDSVLREMGCIVSSGYSVGMKPPFPDNQDFIALSIEMYDRELALWGRDGKMRYKIKRDVKLQKGNLVLCDRLSE